MTASSSFSIRFAMTLVCLGVFVMGGAAVRHLWDERHGAAQDNTAHSQQQQSAPRPMTEEGGINDEQAEAISALMQVLKDKPNDADALLRIGNIFLRAGDWARAEVFLTRATLSRPSGVQARYSLGISLYQQGKYAEAAKMYEEALELEEYPPVLYNLGIIYKYHMNSPDKALKLFKKVVESPTADGGTKAKAKEEIPTD